MARAPRVSVVLIFYQTGAYLDEAIRSIVAQSLPDWELLLVDDGSTDDGTEIAQRWSGADPSRIRFLEHPGHANLGMSASRNLGLRVATADLVTFLDGDDVLRSETLASLVALMEQQPDVAMAYAPLEYWHSWSPARTRRDFVQPLGVAVGAVLQPPDLLVRFLARRAAAPSGVIVRADRAREVHGFEDSFRGMYEDQAFCAKICLRWAVATGAYVGYRYRQHAASSSALADGSGEVEAGRADFLSWLERYLSREEVRDPRLLATVRRERWWLRHPRLHRFARAARRARRRIHDGLVRRAARLLGARGPRSGGS